MTTPDCCNKPTLALVPRHDKEHNVFMWLCLKCGKEIRTERSVSPRGKINDQETTKDQS